MIELNNIIHADCMDIMRDIPDKYFELAIVDPPYGINKGKQKSYGLRAGMNYVATKYESKIWDNEIPNKKYFNDLYRISKNQIIFGANHFVNYIPPSRGWIFWDKGFSPDFSFSKGELAFTSFDRVLEITKIYLEKNTVSNNYEKALSMARIHPTQKPIALYRWLLQNYAKPGDKIIDTHSGSGSCAIACHLEKFEFLAIEKDKDYYEASVKRLDEVRSQGVLF